MEYYERLVQSYLIAFNHTWVVQTYIYETFVKVEGITLKKERIKIKSLILVPF